MAKHINDLMSKYLLSLNVSRKKTHQATEEWLPLEHDGDSQQTSDRDESSRYLIDFSAAFKCCFFSVRAQLSFMEELLSSDTLWHLHNSASCQHTAPVRPEWITLESE